MGPIGIAAVVVAWGSTFTATEVALESAPPILFSGMRCLAGGAVVGVIAWSQLGSPDLRRTWRIHSVLAWWSVTAFIGLQTLALTLMTSGQSAVLIYLQPLLVAVIAWRRLGESIEATQAVGLSLGFLGIGVISTGFPSDRASSLGAGFAVAGAAAWAVGTVAFRRHHDDVDPLWAVAIPFLVGGLALTLLGALAEGTDITWTPRLVGALGYASLVGTSLAWWLWLQLLSAGEVNPTAAYVFLVPVVAVLSGAVLLGEAVGPGLAVGGGLVVLGVLLVNRRQIGSYGPDARQRDGTV